jgi:hypothetical protein
MDKGEIMELDFNDNWEESKYSTNFGGGLELLMNDKIKENKYSNNSKADLEDLTDLENDLNDLVNDKPTYKASSDLFTTSNTPFNLNYEDEDDNLGKSTAQTDNVYNSRTWDGYGKFNNIPINPDKSVSFEPNKHGKEETLKEKFKLLKKLTDLEKKGIELSKKYTMESSLIEMQGEYDSIVEDMSKKQSIKFQNNIFMTMIQSIEYLNNKFDPFDVKLDGWTEQITENINDYDEIFGELHDKYKNMASAAPEIKLLFQLGSSAMMVHFTNTLLKSSLPNADEIFRQNPDLMRAFQAATLNTMSQTKPGFTGFMNNVSAARGVGGDIGPNGMGPPPPMATQSSKFNNDFNEPPSYNGMKNNFIDTRPNFQDPNYSRQTRPNMNAPIDSNERPDMKGPSDITDILSGLKTKKINIQQSNYNKYNDNASTISMHDIKDLNSEANLPKKSRRRKTANNNSNTVSLDI